MIILMTSPAWRLEPLKHYKHHKQIYFTVMQTDTAHCLCHGSPYEQ